MNRILYYFVIIAAFAIVVFTDTQTTPSEQCSGESFDDLRERIQVIPCGKSRCKLRKGSNTTVVFRFNPKHEVKTLTNDVYADIGGIPLPFIGVTGQNACSQVTSATDGKPTPCPLKPNQEYLYTNVFPIQDFYPSVSLRVHWSLKDGEKNVICFEMPAVIKK